MDQTRKLMRYAALAASVVALVPAVAYTATRTLTAEDLNRIDWSVLILIAGGIALGAGMTLTGLDRLVVQALPLGAGGLGWLAALLVAAALVLSIFMSNTAASNLLLPIGISAAAAFDSESATRQVAVSIALAYSRGALAVRAMVLPDVLIGLAGATLVALAAGPLIRFWQ